MANANEICSITADGQVYNIWESVEIHRSVDGVSGGINHALMTVSEISTGGAGFSNLKLTIGDTVQMSLAGINVINGSVYLRQAACDDKTHAVQIGVTSRTGAVVRTTVDVAPGSYPNQTIQQICSACFGKVGVGFNVIGSPSGVDQKFSRVCEQLGESRFNFIERLCRMVNLHMMDDGNGNMLAFRGPRGNVSSQLQEGVNILRARLLLQVDDHVETYGAVGQSNNPSSGPSGAQNMATATATSPGKPIGGMVKFGAEEALTSGMLQMRANHQVDYDAMKTVDGMITVQGWFAPDGDIWWNKVRQTITVNSPMLIPEGSMNFIIKEVVHRQSTGEGTTTDVMITNELGLGGLEAYGQAANPQPA
jgi:prophage tail gpP-like protein